LLLLKTSLENITYSPRELCPKLPKTEVEFWGISVIVEGKIIGGNES
jgi:hypothetical protein